MEVPSLLLHRNLANLSLWLFSWEDGKRAMIPLHGHPFSLSPCTLRMVGLVRRLLDVHHGCVSFEVLPCPSDITLQSIDNDWITEFDQMSARASTDLAIPSNS